MEIKYFAAIFQSMLSFNLSTVH